MVRGTNQSAIVSDVNPMSSAMSILAAGARARRIRNMTPEELEYRNTLMQIDIAWDRYYSSIYSLHKCPNCESSLIRGKKEKKRDYKRAFLCKGCNITHYI